MVKHSIDALVRSDDKLAKAVILSDHENNELRTTIINELVNDFIIKDGTLAPRALPLILITRDLERIEEQGCMAGALSAEPEADRVTVAAFSAGSLAGWEEERFATIWMMNVLVPLDIVFLDDSGQVVELVADAQPCAAEPCPRFTPGTASRAVLELAAGSACQTTVRDLVERAREIVLAIDDPMRSARRVRRRDVERLVAASDQHGAGLVEEACSEETFEVGRLEHDDRNIA